MDSRVVSDHANARKDFLEFIIGPQREGAIFFVNTVDIYGRPTITFRTVGEVNRTQH
jgi:hypothetical protein